MKNRFSYELYFGTQVDPFFDNPQNMENLRQVIQEMSEENGVPLRFKTIRYPMNYGLIDITAKWNMVIDQAYRDGCDYFYQFSDDTKFLSNGWTGALVNCLENQHGFGTAGMTDVHNCCTITLSFSGRKHIELFGSYWPTIFKNWWSDDWARKSFLFFQPDELVTNFFFLEHVYKKYFCRVPNHAMENIQNYGQRYENCKVSVLYEELTRSRRKIRDFLLKNKAEYPSIDPNEFNV